MFKYAFISFILMVNARERFHTRVYDGGLFFLPCFFVVVLL